ncbi:MAG: 16S rRNA (cytidine(1402)-2'-O)-methyltransferase [Calditrichota bacterium]
MTTARSTLYIVATPIGNLSDLSHRAEEILGSVEAVACEDTRRTRILYQKFGLVSPPEILSYREHTENRAGRRIIELLGQGKSVALCSDGGFPGISDPGYRIVGQAIEAGFRVEVIPGASAVLTALVVSGLPTSSFTFKGFPPRKPGPLRRFLDMETAVPHTLIFFESPFRVGTLLQAAFEVYGDRRAAVCIELTKMFEQVDRGWLSELSESYKDRKIKGESTIVIAGANPKFLREPEAETPSESLAGG